MIGKIPRASAAALTLVLAAAVDTGHAAAQQTTLEPDAELRAEAARACREGFAEVEVAVRLAPLDAGLRARVDTLLAMREAAKQAGDVPACRAATGELRQILHLDH